MSEVRALPSPTRTLPCGERVAALGQGTWRIGDDPARRAQEVATLQRGLDLGLSLIDTAEMYGDGRAESVVGAALAGRRERAFVVSKVLPHNASLRRMRPACEASLRRLGIETIDLYLLHWPGAVPLAETVQAFEDLQRAGKIRHWGVSNFDTQAMDALWRTPGGRACQTNQVLYHLAERGIEWDLLPALRARGLPTMAYCPFDEGRLLRHPALRGFAQRHAMSAAQVALAWLLAQDGVIAIPKTGRLQALQDNAQALACVLTPAQRAELDALFPPPDGARALAVI